MGAQSEEDTSKALQEPASDAGVASAHEVLAEIYRVTAGHRYFLHEWGCQTWNLARESPIGLAVVHAATAADSPRLDSDFLGVRFDRLTPGERRFLRAMQQLDA